MALLAAKVRLVEALGALGVAFAGGQLPSSRALDALVAPRTAAAAAGGVARAALPRSLAEELSYGEKIDNIS